MVENDSIVIGCGGHYTKETQHGIAWVMFEQGSIGASRLLDVAKDFMKKLKVEFDEKVLYDVFINTTQLMEKFFNRFEFHTYEIIKDGFGKGLDEYKMKKQFA